MKYYLPLLIIIFAVPLRGQMDTVGVASLLSNSERGKLKNAENNLDQGKSMLMQYKRDEASYVPALGYDVLFRDIVINNKTGRLLLDSKDYFWEGYISEIDIFKKYIDYFLESTNTQLTPSVLAWNDSIEFLLSDAMVQRNQSEKTANLKKAARLIHASNKKLMKALGFSKKAVNSILTESLPLENEIVEAMEPDSAVKEVDSIVHKEIVIASKPVINESELIEPEPTAVRPIEKPEAKQEDVNAEVKQEKVVDVVVKKAEPEVVEGNPEVSGIFTMKKDKETYVDPKLPYERGVFFSVQFLATHKRVAKDGVATVYNGSYPVLENWGAGWYRYSFGKFKTLTKAKQALIDSKVTGFIVAYKDGKKIPFKEAFKYLIR